VSRPTCRCQTKDYWLSSEVLRLLGSLGSSRPASISRCTGRFFGCNDCQLHGKFSWCPIETSACNPQHSVVRKFSSELEISTLIAAGFQTPSILLAPRCESFLDVLRSPQPESPPIPPHVCKCPDRWLNTQVGTCRGTQHGCSGTCNDSALHTWCHVHTPCLGRQNASSSELTLITEERTAVSPEPLASGHDHATNHRFWAWSFCERPPPQPSPPALEPPSIPDMLVSPLSSDAASDGLHGRDAGLQWRLYVPIGIGVLMTLCMFLRLFYIGIRLLHTRKARLHKLELEKERLLYQKQMLSHELAKYVGAESVKQYTSEFLGSVTAGTDSVNEGSLPPSWSQVRASATAVGGVEIEGGPLV